MRVDMCCCWECEIRVEKIVPMDSFWEDWVCILDFGLMRERVCKEVSECSRSFPRLGSVEFSEPFECSRPLDWLRSRQEDRRVEERAQPMLDISPFEAVEREKLASIIF